MIIGKTYSFDAAHWLPGHEYCGNCHGHTYTVTVELRGSINKQGFVIDFHELNEIMKPIIEQYDHKLLNEKNTNPTCEYLAQGIALKVLDELPEGVKLNSLTLREGGGGYARIEGA